MSGGPTDDPHSLEYKFEFIDHSGDRVSFRYVSIDQSRAFSVRPDLNKFEVTLIRASGVIAGTYTKTRRRQRTAGRKRSATWKSGRRCNRGVPVVVAGRKFLS